MTAKLPWVLISLILVGCSNKSVDPTGVRKLSDEFMSDLISHRADAAFDKVEPEFMKMVNRPDFTPQLEKLSQYCGWPRDSELKDRMPGYKVYADGHANPTLKFIYAANANQFVKGQCYFSVEVAPAGHGVRVTSFGPLKVMSGNPCP